METGDGDVPFAYNCDIATPMERDDDSTYGVDLFIDVLVRADTSSHLVGDEAEFEEMLDRGLVSRSEGRGARHGLRELLALVERGHLLPWLHERAPFRPSQPPVATPMERGPIPERLQPAFGARGEVVPAHRRRSGDVGRPPAPASLLGDPAMRWRSVGSHRDGERMRYRGAVLGPLGHGARPGRSRPKA